MSGCFPDAEKLPCVLTTAALFVLFCTFSQCTVVQLGHESAAITLQQQRLGASLFDLSVMIFS